MGICILRPGIKSFEIEPFKKNALRLRVQLWFNVRSNQCNIEFRKSKRQKNFAVEFSADAFRIITGTAGDSLRKFAQQLNRKELSFSETPLTMNAEMHQCIYRITHYEGDEELKKMFLYSQIVQLLLSIQARHLESQRAKPVYLKNDYDRERILYSRDYLITHMDAPPSIPKLAAIVGINEFKLKQGFREMFGHTPFGYLADVRMEMAKTALRKKEKPITQIAFELGFASPQHFSMAFKKKFGVPPRKFGS